MGSRLLEEPDPTTSPVIERLEREIDRLHAELEAAREAFVSIMAITDKDSDAHSIASQALPNQP